MLLRKNDTAAVEITALDAANYNRSANIRCTGGAVSGGGNSLFWGHSSTAHMSSMGALSGSADAFIGYACYHSNTADTLRATYGTPIRAKRIINSNAGGTWSIDVAPVTTADNDIASWSTVFRLTVDGNIGINQTTFGTSAAGVLALKSGTGPTAAYPADAAGFYVTDRGGTAGKGSIHVWAEDGTKHVFGDLVGICRIDPAYALDVTGALRCSTGFGCNGKTPQTAYASGGALAAYGTGAFGFDSDAHASALHALVVSIRAALVADGIMS